MDVKTQPPTWGARARALGGGAAPSPSTVSAHSPIGSSRPRSGTPRQTPGDASAAAAAATAEAPAPNSGSNSAEISPAASLSNSLSSSLGLSSSFVLASHLLAAPTPINTPNFGSAYIHRAARAGAVDGRDGSAWENSGGIIDFRKWLVRSRPPRRWVGEDEDADEDEADGEVDIEEENEDDEVEVGHDDDDEEPEKEEEEENLDDDVENEGDATRKGQAIPHPRR